MSRVLGILMSAAAAVLLVLPSTVSAQRAGSLIAAQPVSDAPAGMLAWRVRYWTTSDRNQPIQVTGMVIAPNSRAGGAPRRVIAWTHGTSGVAQHCAPSAGNGNFTVIPALSDAIGGGYTVVAPDYPGLGSDMVHPYLVGVGTGRSVLDAVRAASSIPDAGAGPRFAVWGESQGGHAALWTGQLTQRYAPELDLVGIAAIVPPTDLVRNFAEGRDKRVRAMLTAFTAASWLRYFGAPMSTFGRRSTQNVMLRLADDNCVELRARPRLGTIIGIAAVQRAIRNLDLGRQEPWGRLMRENSPSPDAVAVPLMIAEGTADTVVAPAVTLDFARRACARGKTVHYISVPGGEHATVARTEAQDTLDWIEARFAGRQAPND